MPHSDEALIWGESSVIFYTSSTIHYSALQASLSTFQCYYQHALQWLLRLMRTDSGPPWAAVGKRGKAPTATVGTKTATEAVRTRTEAVGSSRGMVKAAPTSPSTPDRVTTDHGRKKVRGQRATVVPTAASWPTVMQALHRWSPLGSS